MTEILHGHLYDYPKYYDLVYGSDWRAEFDFLQACFDKHSDRPIQRLFEPACGTGRLMIKLAERGYEVAGNDLNAKAIAFCNERLLRRGYPSSAQVGDMSDFRLPRKVDAAYNMINSFRHLMTEAAARSHFECISRCLAKGGLYVVGIHLTPTEGNRVEEEEWAARRGNLAVVSSMWTTDLDLKRRIETVGMSFDIYTPTQHTRILDEMYYRTYTARQFRNLLARTPELEPVAVYDFTYDIGETIQVGPQSEDTVWVLRKR